MVKSVVLSWEKGRNPVVNVVVGKMLVKVLFVVAWRRVAGLVDVACL